MTDAAVAYEAFRDALNRLTPGWTVAKDGIIGPRGAKVWLGQRHSSESEGHVDVQFTCNTNSHVKVDLWDCIFGCGSTHADRAHFAAHLWANTTATALLELAYSLHGEFADHYRGNEPDGFRGWHAICGKIMGYGESASRLQHWWLNNSLLPTLAENLDNILEDQTAPHGIKIFFGGADVAEVRLNGESHEGASMALGALGWPRLQPAGFVRSYVVLLHRESGLAVERRQG